MSTITITTTYNGVESSTHSTDNQSEGYFESVRQAANYYRAQVKHNEKSFDYSDQAGGAELDVYNEIREENEDVPQAEFDAFWTDVENAL